MPAKQEVGGGGCKKCPPAKQEVGKGARKGACGRWAVWQSPGNWHHMEYIMLMWSRIVHTTYIPSASLYHNACYYYKLLKLVVLQPLMVGGFEIETQIASP